MLENAGPRRNWSEALIWTVEWDDKARRELRKLDHTVQSNILRYFRERIMVDDDPKRFGKPLRHELFEINFPCITIVIKRNPHAP